LLYVLGMVLVLLLAGWATGHLLFAVFFARRVVARGLERGQLQEHEEPPEFAPHASVIVSLRGFDPSLRSHLIGLLNQDYEKYEIIVVIDSRADAAWKVVEEIKAEYDTGGLLHFFPLENPSDSCSLKCNSVSQAFSKVDARSEVIALVDADVVPHQEWLKHVVTPLVDPKIGASTGNQWYSPPDESVGSLLRCMWNSGSLTPSAIYGNPWAGSCALRVSDVRRLGLVDAWKNSAVDDGPIKKVLAPAGLRVHFEPRLIMINRDACTFAYVNRYAVRMLTWSRLYESEFLNTIVHMLITVALLVASAVLLGYSIVSGNGLAALFVGVGLLIANAILVYAFFVVRGGVQKSIAHRNETLERTTSSRFIKVFCLMPVCLVSHCFWTVAAMFSKQIDWRNVTYRLEGQDKIQMVQYRPYQSEPDQTPSRVSI